MRRNRGIALPLVLFILMILFPMTMYFMKKSSDLVRVTRHERMGGAARRLGSNLAEDYLSQFTKGMGYYENHFSPAVLNRTRTFFESGYSSVTVQMSAVARTVLIRARGDYGLDPAVARNSRTLEAQFRFIPLIGQFLIQSSGHHSFGIAGATYQGPIRAEGDISVTAANVTFAQPIIAGQAVNGLGNTLFQSQVYYGTTFAPAYNVVNYPAGVPIRDTPPGAPFIIDRSFYQINSGTISAGTTVWWEFQDNLGIGQYRSRWDTNGDNIFDAADPAFGPWVNIPGGGQIFFVDQAKTYISGTIRGRVTIVCTTTNQVGHRGVIEIQGSLGYATGNLANTNGSLFALATSGFIFATTAPAAVPDILTVSGAYYVENPFIVGNGCPGTTAGMYTIRLNGGGANLDGIAGDQLVLIGSRNNTGFCNRFPVPYSLQFDPNLQLFPSPGVPERAVLTSWRRVTSD